MLCLTIEDLFTKEEMAAMSDTTEFIEKKATILKDSGTRSTFDTGAVRDGQAGKGRMDLMPVRALIEVSKIFEAGAIKYDSRNWERGIPLSRFMDSGLRHALKWLRGDRDEPHLAQACWNFLCLLDTQLRIQEGMLPLELNDLPHNPIDVDSADTFLGLYVVPSNVELDDEGREIK